MSDQLKTCKDCLQDLPLNAFYSKGSGYLDSRCKRCANKKRHERRMSNPEVHERDKATSRRSHSKHREKQNAHNRQHRQENVEYYRAYDRQRYYSGKREYNREWRKRNRERYITLQRASYRRHIEKRREEKRTDYAANPELYRERSRQNNVKWRDKKQEYNRQWRINNRQTKRVNEHRRNARKRLLPDTFTHSQWLRALDYFDNRCAYCGRHQGLWHTISMEHFIPVSGGGGTTALNVVPACFAKKDGTDSCNSSKRNAPAAEWLTRKFGKKKAAEILARIEAYFKWVQEQDSN